MPGNKQITQRSLLLQETLMLALKKLIKKQEKEMNDIWNEFACRTRESGGTKNETQFLMIGDVLTASISLQKYVSLYTIYKLKGMASNFSENELRLLELLQKMQRKCDKKNY